MERGILDHWATVAGIIGIPVAAIAVFQAVEGVLPWHAIAVSSIMGGLLMVQGCTPWRYRTWKRGDLAKYGALLSTVNALIFCVVFVLAGSCIAVAYVWQGAPAWIEDGIESAVQTKKVQPIAAASQVTLSGGTSVPSTAIASISPPPPTSIAATPLPSPFAQSVALYPTNALLTEAIGSTNEYSKTAYLGVLVQVLFIILLMLVEPIAEKAFRQRS
jgi:hypothetical protein